MKNNSNRSLRSCAAKGLIAAFLAVGVVLQIFPLLWMADFSLLKDTEVFGGGILKLPNPPQWINYAYAWTNGHVARNFVNSLIVCGVVIVLVSFFSLTLGYAFTRIEWKLRGVFFTVILLSMMIPIYSTLLPNFSIYHTLGLTNTYWSLILPYAAFNLPVGVFIMTGFLETLPKALEESAIIDGCTTFGVIFRIIAPITKPAIATVSIMTFIPCWNEFIMALTYITDARMKTLPFSIWEFAGQYFSQYSKQFAVYTLASLPVVLLYIILNKQITEGVIAGSVKG